LHTYRLTLILKGKPICLLFIVSYTKNTPILIDFIRRGKMAQNRSEVEQSNSVSDELYKTLLEIQFLKGYQKFNFNQWLSPREWGFETNKDNAINKFQELYIKLKNFKNQNEIPNKRWTPEQDTQLRERIKWLLTEEGEGVNNPTVSISKDGKISVTCYSFDSPEEFIDKFLKRIKEFHGFGHSAGSLVKQIQQQRSHNGLFAHIKSKTYSGYSLEEISKQIKNEPDPALKAAYKKNIQNIQDLISDEILKKINFYDPESENTFRKFLELQYVYRDPKGKETIDGIARIDDLQRGFSMLRGDLKNFEDLPLGLKEAVDEAYTKIATIETNEMEDPKLKAIIVKAKEFTTLCNSNAENDSGEAEESEAGLSDNSDTDSDTDSDNEEDHLQSSDEDDLEVENRYKKAENAKKIVSEPAFLDDATATEAVSEGVDVAHAVPDAEPGQRQDLNSPPKVENSGDEFGASTHGKQKKKVTWGPVSYRIIPSRAQLAQEKANAPLEDEDPVSRVEAPSAEPGLPVEDSRVSVDPQHPLFQQPSPDEGAISDAGNDSDNDEPEAEDDNPSDSDDDKAPVRREEAPSAEPGSPIEASRVSVDPQHPLYSQLQQPSPDEGAISDAENDSDNYEPEARDDNSSDSEDEEEVVAAAEERTSVLNPTITSSDPDQNQQVEAQAALKQKKRWRRQESIDEDDEKETEDRENKNMKR
jgi:hypothetical protein